MATIGPKEAQRREQREAKIRTTRTVLAGIDDGAKKAPKPPAEPATKESSVSKKKAKKAAAKAKAKKPPKVKAKAKAAAPKKAKPAKPGVDRSPLTVGNFIVDGGTAGVTMAALEKRFKMDAHPLRSKIWTAKHVLGFTILYDANRKVYTGTTPAVKEAAQQAEAAE